MLRRVGLSATLLFAIGAACNSTAPPPGGLVRTTVTGTVGVLLEVLPESMRDRAAQEIIARPQSFWMTRATRQAHLTRLRLIFRRYYSIGEGQANKAQLPLPPDALWQFSFDAAGPKRTTVDGHDVVTLGYTITSTLLSDDDSPAQSEPALTDVGGTWDEPFTMPVDPEVVFQLTGFSCMRESDTPKNSVDGEDIEYFYDSSCLGTAEGQQNCHYTVPSTPMDCTTALAAQIGSVPANVHYERLAWDPTLAAQVRVGKPTGNYPDLSPDPTGMTNNRIIYRYFPSDSCALVEQCIGAPGWRRVVQFDADVVDVGSQPLDIGAVTDTSQLVEHNVFYYSVCHGHMHFRFYGNFSFPGASDNSKKGFCLLSSSRVHNDETTSLNSPYDLCTLQGISNGWRDEYEAGLDCQWVDITPIDTSKGPVTQALGFQVNPEKFLCEGTPDTNAQGDLEFEPSPYKTETGEPIDQPLCSFAPGVLNNNSGSTSITIPEVGGFVTTPCARGQIGVARDCGYTDLRDMRTCVPGAPVTLSCTAGTAATPQLLRLCEASTVLNTGTACVFRDALTNAALTDTPTTVTFTCPVQRDDQEVGGHYSLYASPVFDGDPSEPVTCTEMP